MGSPYGFELVENCLICKLRTDSFFCSLPKTALEAFDKIKYAASYPAGAILFVEGQSPRGIYMLCKGRVKLSTTSAEGKTLILKIAQPGEVLGMHATVSGTPYEITAETGQPCQLNFVKRDDFLSFLQKHGDACLKADSRRNRTNYWYVTRDRDPRPGGFSQAAGRRPQGFYFDHSQ